MWLPSFCNMYVTKYSIFSFFVTTIYITFIQRKLAASLKVNLPCLIVAAQKRSHYLGDIFLTNEKHVFLENIA